MELDDVSVGARVERVRRGGRDGKSLEEQPQPDQPGGDGELDRDAATGQRSDEIAVEHDSERQRGRRVHVDIRGHGAGMHAHERLNQKHEGRAVEGVAR